jgi:hypothetical protein
MAEPPLIEQFILPLQLLCKQPQISPYESGKILSFSRRNVRFLTPLHDQVCCFSAEDRCGHRSTQPFSLKDNSLPLGGFLPSCFKVLPCCKHEGPACHHGSDCIQEIHPLPLNDNQAEYIANTVYSKPGVLSDTPPHPSHPSWISVLTENSCDGHDSAQVT